MDKQELRKNGGDMLYLAACAVSGRTPSSGRISRMELEQLFTVCEKHSMTAICAYALEAAGVKDHEFIQAKEKAVRKNIILDMERRGILRRLEAEGIWYMPLKGVLLKDWYPKLGMRQMTDNDILFDPAKRQRVREIMEELGFECKHYCWGPDDAYYKEPVCNFEMHVELFNDSMIGELGSYYRNIKDKLLRDEGCEYAYHFTNEDYYIYLLAHEYKHYMDGGTGVRSLLDTYVFLSRFGDELDWEYVYNELEKLGIAGYERESRELAMKLFSFGKLTVKDKKNLDYYVQSGIFGRTDTRVKNELERSSSKSSYILSRIFPPMEVIRNYYPFFYRHKLLIPLLWVIRPVRLLVTDPEKLKTTVKTLSEE